MFLPKLYHLVQKVAEVQGLMLFIQEMLNKYMLSWIMVYSEVGSRLGEDS